MKNDFGLIKVYSMEPGAFGDNGVYCETSRDNGIEMGQ